MERKIGMKKSIKRTLLGILLFVTVLTIPSFTWTKSNVKNIETFYNSRLSPIIMIPGSSATEDRFDSLVDKLNMNRQEDKHSQKDKLKYRDAFDIIQRWLNQQKAMGLTETDRFSFLRKLSIIDQTTYLRAQKESLAMLQWLKRYVRAFVKEEKSETPEE